MKIKWLYFLISLFVIVPGMISLVLYGLKPSIDFTGGTIIQIQLNEKDAKTVQVSDVEKSIGDVMKISSVQVATDNMVIIKGTSVDVTQNTEIISKLNASFGKLEQKRFETIGPVLGKELILKTVAAIVLSAGLITMYVAYRFKSIKFGVCAVLAMLHDTLVLIGSFSLLGHFFAVEVDTLFVTAILTVLSFSVHDTIVVYDRIRELTKKLPATSFTELVNVAVTETMGRSLNNSLTVILMLIALWLLGGETVRWFVFALLVGMVTGTYSSTFTAAPLLVLWDDLRKKKNSKKH